MSMRTIVEFNNDRLDELKRDGHISDALFNILIWGGSDGYSTYLSGIEVKDVIHHTVIYRILYE